MSWAPEGSLTSVQHGPDHEPLPQAGERFVRLTNMESREAALTQIGSGTYVTAAAKT